MTGKDITIVLMQDSSAVASSKIRSQDIQTHCDLLERASQQQQSWKEYEPGRAEWAVTVNYLVLASERVADLLMVRQKFDVLMQADGVTILTGTAIMTDVQQTATIGNLAQGAFTLKGTGAISNV